MVIHVQKDIEDMKKIYMSPAMDVIELKNQQSLLAGSVLGIDSNATFSDEGSVGAPEFEIEIPEAPYPYSEL